MNVRTIAGHANTVYLQLPAQPFRYHILCPFPCSLLPGALVSQTVWGPTFGGGAGGGAGGGGGGGGGVPAG